MKRPFFRPLRVAVMFAAVLVVLVALTPLGLYVLGLNNVDGRPLPLSSSTLTPEDEALLERTLRVSHPITVERLTPWAYVTFILADSHQPVAAQGARAAWFIAQNYNAHHLKDRRMIWWHLSGAALTIWITRHWSSDEVLRAAAALASQSGSSRLKL